MPIIVGILLSSIGMAVMKRNRQQHNRLFGEAVRKARKLRQLSQDELAYLAGIDRTYMSIVELGQSSPTLDTMQAISAALEVKLSELIIEVESMNEA